MAISVGLAYSLNLKELYLSNNHLTSLEGLSNLRDLVVLDVGFNQISELREVVKLKANTNLRELILLGNPLAYKK